MRKSSAYYKRPPSRFHRKDRVRSPDGLTGEVLIVSGANNLLVYWDDHDRAGQRSGWWMPDGFELIERPTSPAPYELEMAELVRTKEAEIAARQELPRRTT